MARFEPAYIPLENAFVRLEPIRADHLPQMQAVHDRAPETFALNPSRGGDGWFAAYLAQLTAAAEARRILAYAVIPRGSDVALGHTSLMNPDPVHGAVEVGSTWYAPQVQGTAVNPACKRLLMQHAFAAGAVRCYFYIDVRNTRSIAAVRKLGAVEEGVLRHHRVLPTGYLRDSMVLSILAGEWPAVRERLDARLAAFTPGAPA